MLVFRRVSVLHKSVQQVLLVTDNQDHFMAANYYFMVDLLQRLEVIVS